MRWIRRLFIHSFSLTRHCRKSQNIFKTNYFQSKIVGFNIINRKWWVPIFQSPANYQSTKAFYYHILHCYSQKYVYGHKLYTINSNVTKIQNRLQYVRFLSVFLVNMEYQIIKYFTILRSALHIVNLLYRRIIELVGHAERKGKINALRCCLDYVI